MHPGRHKQVSCSPAAFSPSYQGFRMCVVLHRPEAFVSSCRTSLSSRVTCMAIEPSQRPRPGNLRLCGRPFACSHKANCPRWPDFPCVQDALDPSRERACPVSEVSSRTGCCCFNLINASGGIIPAEAFSATAVRSYCSHGRPSSTCFIFRESC